MFTALMAVALVSLVVLLKVNHAFAMEAMLAEQQAGPRPR
jgi:hypothetical protein